MQFSKLTELAKIAIFYVAAEFKGLRGEYRLL